jgi:hypothetical protein
MNAPGAQWKFVTLGVYGFTAEAFFQALQRAGVDTFCDIRWRRGRSAGALRGRRWQLPPNLA